MSEKTPYVHAALIKDYISQVVFIRSKNCKKWFPESMPLWNPDCEYFVVCAKHADVCLHWLNGGKVEYYGVCTESWVQSDRPMFHRSSKYRKAITEEQKVEMYNLKMLIESNNQEIKNHSAKIRDLTNLICKLEADLRNYEILMGEL